MCNVEAAILVDVSRRKACRRHQLFRDIWMDDMVKASPPVTLKSSLWMYAFGTIVIDVIHAALVVDIDVWRVMNKRLFPFQGSGRIL